jgi:hypothetical protein
MEFLAYVPHLKNLHLAYGITWLFVYLCVCVSGYSPCQILNAWTSLYETWYVYQGT